MSDPAVGLAANRGQVGQLLLQVFFVGLTIGLTRTVVPALAESDFGLPRGSVVLLAAFVVAFGIVKAVMNFVAGRLSERVGRRAVLVAGWITALPIPVMIWAAPSWGWIVAAMVLLGVNQGLAWSMTQTAKLDLTRPEERGLILGLNEFAGYGGVAIAGYLTGIAASAMGPRMGILVIGLAVVAAALILSLAFVRETLPHARAETARHRAAAPGAARPRFPQGLPEHPDTATVLALMSWRDRRLSALSQAGLVEKFVDALVWVFLPVYLYARGQSLEAIGLIAGSYGMVWGLSQLLTGPLSDRIGRQIPNVTGMVLCGAGTILFVLGEGFGWWVFAAAVTGFGMALLYPNLSAAVADITPPAWRGSAIGIYRFWRDLGYAVGALALGIAVWATGRIEAAFWLTGIAMAASGAVLWWRGEETHPRLNPAPPDQGP